MSFLTVKYRNFDIKLNIILDYCFLSTEDKECYTALNCQLKIPQGYTAIFI